MLVRVGHVACQIPFGRTCSWLQGFDKAERHTLGRFGLVRRVLLRGGIAVFRRSRQANAFWDGERGAFPDGPGLEACPKAAFEGCIVWQAWPLLVRRLRGCMLVDLVAWPQTMF